MTRGAKALASFILALSPWLIPSDAWGGTKDFLSKLKALNPDGYGYAISSGAEMNTTAGSKSYSLFWAPSQFRSQKGVLIALSDDEEWLFTEFPKWKAVLERRGMAFLAIQWFGPAPSETLSPEDIYHEIDRIFRRKKMLPGKAILYGAGAGAQISYSVAAIDQSEKGTQFLNGVITNSGAAHLNYFPTQQVHIGMMGDQVYSRLNWVMHCGRERSGVPGVDDCRSMRQTKHWAEKKGAKILLFSQDLTGNYKDYLDSTRKLDETLDLLMP